MRFFKEKHLLSVFLRQVLLNDEVIDDEVLSLNGVLTHIVAQEIAHLVAFVEMHLFETDFGPYEVAELIGGNLAKTFETGNLRVGT